MNIPTMRMRTLSAIVFALSASLVGCDDSPTESANWVDALDIRAEVSRPTFKSGDTTTIRVIYTNKTARTISTNLRNSTSCLPQFDVRKGSQRVAPGIAGIACTLILYTKLDLAPGEQYVVSRVWRGENSDWAVQIGPGKFTVYGMLRMPDRTLEGPGVPIEILP